MLASMTGSSRKRGMFEEPDMLAKRQCVRNPEYQAAFQMFDRDLSGTIDLQELNAALQAVKLSVESGTPQAVFTKPFNPNTMLWLAGKYARQGGGHIRLQEFCEMLQYLESVKNIFTQIDTDRTGDISVSELSRALKLSGFNVTGLPDGGGDALSLAVAEKIGRAYDADGNGVLTFDEFVQLRLEWDSYLDNWAANVAPDSNAISPQQLLAILEAIKASLEPLHDLAFAPAVAGLSGFSPSSFLGPMFYNSMFKVPRPFLHSTAEVLIRKCAGGGALLTFEQFCLLMEFLKEQKKKFTAVDQDRSGAISLEELGVAFAQSGLPLPLEQLLAVARRYDQDQSGHLEFDEFVQMMTEISNF
ncbi:Peflin (PEF protein with a long N-terminal hydrophobic domain) (Penta-EF hand domain-containing protein 1) [Durusdinium trenchii]|uniref:Peflin (PEF protein with a long N-terminal hydrophobic domain) (Penta-EF hand domain-containing protein 1) n=1 Tax=Durusdinium trenchii TaxID=1381693 RepID=A0ABP0R1A4_9DINO